MRKTTAFNLLILFCPSILVAQGSLPQIFNLKDSTTVSGKIDGYSTKQEEQLINYYTHDLSGRQIKFSAPIEKDGKFHFKFLQQYEGNFGLQYGANFILAYAVPGERIEIDIDHDVADKVYHFPGAFKIKGKSAEISRHMLQFFAIYLPVLHQRPPDMKLPTEEFVEEIKRNLQTDLSILNSYIQKNKPPQIFSEWAKNWLTYEAAGFMIIKPFLGRSSTTVTDTQLIRYLGTIEINNDKALNNSSYYDFISRFTGNIQMMINNSSVNYSKLELRESPLAITVALDKIDRYFTGLIREIAYLNLYAYNAYSEASAYKLDQVWDRFDREIKDQSIQHALETKRNNNLKSFTSYNVIEKLNKINVDASLKQNLLSILQKEKGKFVYIDFWGAWCKPCMAEMPYYKAFIDELKNEPVSFLFLAVGTSSKDVKTTQDKFGIPGQFISLNKNEEDLVNEAFGFTGYPSHFLLDPEGNLVTKKLVISINNKESAVTQLKWLMK